MKKLFGQIIKFGAVGFLCYFIDYFIMVALTELAGIPSFVSSACSYTISTVVNYILSITVVFDADKEANQLMMWAGTSWLEGLMGRNSALAAYARYAYMVVKIFATAVVMVYNFITRKIFIEKH